MDTDVVKAFNAELSSIYDSRPPLSKKKIQDISKAALKAKSYYKHVVFSVEKFLAKCKTEYKIPCLYVIDSIIRSSKHQLKEKDVYAARFLKNFSKTLADLLSCPVTEQPRVVRTLNLWSANGVYPEDSLFPFKQQCRDMGIETDVERVERAVKGEAADLSIYGGSYLKKEERRSEKRVAPSTPPHTNNISQFEAQTPPLATSAGILLPVSSKDIEPSDEIPPGAISERQLLDIMRNAGVDFGGSFGSDMGLLRKAHKVICETLQERQKVDSQRHGNIKNLLSSQFDYSDEDDSGDEGKKAKEMEPKPMTQEEILNLADVLIRDQNVINALKTMQQERILALNQVAAAAQAQQRAALAHPSGVNISLPPPSIPLSSGTLSQGLPSGLTSLPGLNLAQLTNLPVGSGSTQNSVTQAALLNMLAANPLVSNLLNQQSGSNIPFSPNRPPPTSMASIDSAQLAKQQELLKQLSAAAPLGVPPPGMGLLGAPPGQQLSQLPPQLQLHIEDVDMRGADADDRDPRGRKDRKRSRSKERGDHKRGRRSRSRERKPEREKVDRERRKLGLPSLQDGLTFIASKTLWFGRLPSNCSENDIKMVVVSAGETKRVSVIPSRACAYVTMETRRAAYDVVHRMGKDMQIARKGVKVSWAIGNGAKDEPYAQWWDSDKGITSVPWDRLPADLEKLCDGGHLDVESLPIEKRGLYSENGVLTMSIPAATTMDMSPQNSPMKIDEPSPTKVPESVPLPHGLPPGFPFPGGAPTGVPPPGQPGPNPFLPSPIIPSFPMRLPMPPGLHGIPGQQMFGVPPHGGGVPPHGIGVPMPLGPVQGSSNVPPMPNQGMPRQQAPIRQPPHMGGPPSMANAMSGIPPPTFGTPSPGRGGFGGGFRGGRGNFQGNRGGYQSGREFNGRETIERISRNGEQQRDRDPRERDGERRQWGERDRDMNHMGRDNERRPWIPENRENRDLDRDRKRDDLGRERRRSRWGAVERDGPWEGDGRRERNERDDRRDDRDRGDRRDNREREDQREDRRDRDRRDRDREGDRRRERGIRDERDGRRDREDRDEKERPRGWERESPQYEDPPQMDEKPLSTSPTDRLSSDKRNGSDDAEAMVTSTTDTDQMNLDQIHELEELRKATINEDDLLESALGSLPGNQA